MRDIKKTFIIYGLVLVFTAVNSAFAENTMLTMDKQMQQALELEQQQKLKSALNLVKKIVSNNADDENAVITLGRLYVKNGKSEKAINALQPLILEESDDWRPWFWTGTAYLLQHKYNEASLHIDEALNRDGNQVSIWVQRAVIEQAKGNTESSIRILQVASNLAKDRPDVFLNLAYGYEQQQDFQKAKNNYRRFLFTSAKSKRYSAIRAEVLFRLAQLP